MLDDYGITGFICKCIDNTHKAQHFAAKPGAPLIVFAINLIDLILKTRKCEFNSYLVAYQYSFIYTMILKSNDCWLSDEIVSYSTM